MNFPVVVAYGFGMIGCITWQCFGTASNTPRVIGMTFLDMVFLTKKFGDVPLRFNNWNGNFFAYA